jgi:hypothetical protein
LPGSVSIAEAGRLYNELLLFERRLLTLYVSYVLAAAGFYDSVTAEVEGRYTTKFSDKDWVEILDFLPPSEDSSILWKPWDWEYENERGEKLRVVFVKVLMEEYNAKTGRSYSSAEVLARYVSGNKDSVGKRNIIVAHPLLSRKERKNFIETKEELQKLLGEDVFSVHWGVCSPIHTGRKEEGGRRGGLERPEDEAVSQPPV